MSIRELDFSKPNFLPKADPRLPMIGGQAPVAEMIDLKEVKRMFGESLNEGCRYLLKQNSEQAMALDFYHHISALRYKRTPLRRSYRNGYRIRSLLTSVGIMELEVPRAREGEYQPTSIKRYKSEFGSCGQNTKSCKRIVFSLFFYFNVKWERQKERIHSVAEYFKMVA
jgi:hypothetical protein